MENTKYGKRREGRWTPIRAKAQDTRANPNSWETHLVRKRWDIGLLRALSLRIMMMMMQRVMKDAMHYCITNDDYAIFLEPNNNTLKAVLNIVANYVVDFTTANSIRTVLGFNSRQHTSGYNESENLFDIISISSVMLPGDIIGASYSNGTTGNVIYPFSPNVGPGYKIIEVPLYLKLLNQRFRKWKRLLPIKMLSIRFHSRKA